MKSKFSLILFFAILLAISLACQTVGGVGDKIQDAGATAQSAATQVQALATQAMGLATSAVDLATQGAPLVETAQAVATENPGIIETAAAAPTALAGGETPEDIPLVDESTRTMFYAMQDSVTYSTSLDFQTVVAFYKEQMPLNGWSADEGFSFESADSAIFSYTKDNRTATVTISTSTDGTTVVLIAILHQ